MKGFYFLPFLLALLFLAGPTFAGKGNNSSVRLHTDIAYLSQDKKLCQDIYYQADTSGKATLSLRCFMIPAKGDSLLLYRMSAHSFQLKKGIHPETLNLSKADGGTYCLPVFYSIIKATGAVPPGTYHILTSLTMPDGSIVSKTIAHQVDSSLSATSPLREDLNTTLLPENKAKLLGIDLSPVARTVNSTYANTAKVVERNTRRIDRLFKSKGLTPVIQKTPGKDYINLYYEEWFVGRYELDLSKSVEGQIGKQKDQVAGNISSFVTNELGSYRSLFSQIKDLKKNQKEKRELTGELALSGNWSTGQEEYSGQDNNYYEVRGHVETEVYDVPIAIEGYYTTQDNHRLAKASYIRFHYDVEKAKSELLKLIGGYKNQFSQTVSKGKGLEQVYGSYLSGLDNQKGRILSELAKEAGVKSLDASTLNEENLKAQITATVEVKMKDSATALLSKEENDLDSSGKAKATAAKAKAVQDSATRVYQRAMKRYNELLALEQKMEKYRALLDNYKNTTYFDSALAYDKLKNLKSGDETTYKQLAKQASGLLPEGKAKTFIAGLTNLDAGIFPKYVSKYTMAGQQIKGLDLGYDFGFCQAGFTVGKTEYVGRDGNLDKYTAYSARVLFTPLKDQHVGLVYYGYTPSRSITSDEFYQHLDIALPTFKEPVHIVSATYSGFIGKAVTVEGEGATSFRNGDGKSFSSGFDADRLAWHLNAEGMIPKTTFTVQGSYEHGGKDFQNSTLPIIISGTDLYRGALKGDFFRSFLTLALEYNHMAQESFASRGGNSRWGFELSTHSKQYPSVSISYKPFTTFRSYADTLNVPQHPLLGAVWTGRASYQVKRKGYSWRFMAVYNKSTSVMDSMSYGSDLAQVSVIYTEKRWMGMLSAGNSQLSTSAETVSSPAHMNTRFVMGSGTYTLSKQVSVDGGADIGFAPFGLSKYGGSVGLVYRLKKLPLSARAMGRYTTYELVEGEGWKQFYSGSVDLIWQFRMKLLD